MYRRTGRQTSLLQPGYALPEEARARLEMTWAPKFSERVYPLLLAEEDEFRALFHAGNGRPNWSVARILGVMFLQEMFGLPDQAALDHLSYDIRWQRALGLELGAAYLSRRSLVAFRSRLVQVDPEGTRLRRLFDKVVAVVIADFGLSIREVRLDATHIRSNIMVRGRLDLFVQTLGRFCRTLKKDFPAHFGRLPAVIQEASAADEDGTFGGLSAEETGARLLDVAKWLVVARDLFENDPVVAELESYQLIKRLIPNLQEDDRSSLDTERLTSYAA